MRALRISCPLSAVRLTVAPRSRQSITGSPTRARFRLVSDIHSSVMDLPYELLYQPPRKWRGLPLGRGFSGAQSRHRLTSSIRERSRPPTSSPTWPTSVGGAGGQIMPSAPGPIEHPSDGSGGGRCEGAAERRRSGLSSSWLTERLAGLLRQGASLTRLSEPERAVCQRNHVEVARLHWTPHGRIAYHFS